MEINNPTEPTLPAALQNAIEKAKNTLTVTEQETKRLIGLARDQENTVRVLLEKKAQLESEVQKEEKRADELKGQVDNLRVEIDAKRVQLDAMTQEIKASSDYILGLSEIKAKVSNLLSELK